MITGEVKSIGIDPDEVAKSLGKMARDLPAALKVAMRSTLGVMVAHAAKNKLLGQVLNRRTGTLIRSVTASPRIAQRGARVVGAFGTKLWYGVAHERGYAGPITVPIHAVKAHSVKAHHVAGHTRKTKGGVVTVSAHSVRAHNVRGHLVGQHQAIVNYRARRYLSATLTEKSSEAMLRFKKAIWYLGKFGKVPRPSDLGRSASGLNALGVKRAAKG